MFNIPIRTVNMPLQISQKPIPNKKPQFLVSDSQSRGFYFPVGISDTQEICLSYLNFLSNSGSRTIDVTVARYGIISHQPLPSSTVGCHGPPELIAPPL